MNRSWITLAEWRALLAHFPEGVVPPHFTLSGDGPKYLGDADLVTVADWPRPASREGDR